MTRKTIRNRGFEPWTFRSCLGYQHFVINYNNRDQRKKDSKKTSTTTVAEIKTKANVAEKASALVAATDHGGKFLNTFTPVINSAWIIDSGATDHMTFDSRQVSPLRPSSQKIVSTANGNTTPCSSSLWFASIGVSTCLQSNKPTSLSMSNTYFH